MASFSVISLNCHGFNAGTAAYLHRACKSVDVILLQETWLSDVNGGKIGEFLCDFDVFHTSAKEHKLSTSFPCGRPFGGTAKFENHLALIRIKLLRTVYAYLLYVVSLKAAIVWYSVKYICHTMMAPKIML